jgi:hypothetical protein
MVSWFTDKGKHSALTVFQDPEHNLRTSAEFRLFEVLQKRQALFSELDCAELKKEDCKPEATERKCAWDLEKKTCTICEELASGTKVVRGPDWSWGNQDGKQGGTGVTQGAYGEEEDGWVRVKWDHDGYTENYRMGAGGKYDLKVAPARCPAPYVAAAEEQIPKENLGSFCTPEVDACADKCSGMENCTAFSFKKMSTTRRCVTRIAKTVHPPLNGNCILLGGESYGSQDEFLDEYNIKRSSFSHRVCLRREGSSGIVALKQRSNQTPLTPDLK